MTADMLESHLITLLAKVYKTAAKLLACEDDSGEATRRQGDHTADPDAEDPPPNEPPPPSLHYSPQSLAYFLSANSTATP